MNITAQVHDQVRHNHGFIRVNGFVFRNRNLVEKPAAFYEIIAGFLETNNYLGSSHGFRKHIEIVVSKNTPDLKPERK